MLDWLLRLRWGEIKSQISILDMAGGRKTMSAAMAMLAQIYSGRAITPVLVPTEIESKGVISELEKVKDNKEKRKEVLHLKDKNLILLPIIGIA
ncbi:MAG: hypothetical protein KIH08_12370 [Candidatus Freyarchaeota archaeon]|nr:hypothetical protein [Candidatus Jordarchaeia archaeon]MBS7270080.1 hypothetical protein [Candidatus Jordarchaeia archaeon]MBS7280742.1 hypothetical protein [Candidatus Jordarchaeia archaeon]